MRIGEPRRPGATRGAAKTRGAVAKTAGPPAASARNITDTATVMGVPTAELTPKVRDALMRLMAKVESMRQEIEQQKARIAYLEQLANQDTLTPVANRRAFVRELSRVMSYGERYGTPSSVIYFDLNGLKEINDTWGHAAGDAAIVKVANLLVENVRESDIVGRLGGDEFGVILVRADKSAAAEKSAWLVEEFEGHPLEWEGTEIALDLAYGVYTLTGGEEAGDALAAADRAMYVHKRGQSGDYS